jgi:hypothetical protein
MNDVPCGSCTQCCQWGGEDLKPDPSLQAKDNGDCQHLDRILGCTIWEQRPAACRDFDCRNILRAVGNLTLTKIIIAAAKINEKNC